MGTDPDSDPETWDPETCIAFLEADAEAAPEYDLETARGVALLREDCRRRLTGRSRAA